jgi:hypothetical protein
MWPSLVSLKLKLYKSRQIPAEITQAGGETCCKIHKLVLFGARKNCLRNDRSLLYSLSKVGYSGHRAYYCYQCHRKCYPSRLSPHEDEIIWDHQCRFRRNNLSGVYPFLGHRIGVQWARISSIGVINTIKDLRCMNLLDTFSTQNSLKQHMLYRPYKSRM